MTHQYIIINQEQLLHLTQELGWDLGSPRHGPGGMLLTNLNGNVPFNEDELAILTDMEVEIVPDNEIQIWLELHGWDAPVEEEL